MSREIRALIGESDASLDAHYQHALYYLEGYRTVVLAKGGPTSCPYAPGSARDLSWRMGEVQALRDLLEAGVKISRSHLKRAERDLERWS